MLDHRAIWGTAPPEPRSRLNNWATVLFSWWCTSSAAVIILTRVLGRKVRSDRLFREDWIMLLSLFPLFVRMVFIHFVLIYGTNNIDTTKHELTELELYHHSVGSRLVLCARIFYAMFIWSNKLCVSEFLKGITIKAWRKNWELTLQGIRVFLFATFGAVVIATLSECQPFDHYWQVVPDPGAHCRQGFAQLLTMGTCDIVTDILLIAFPIPVVLKSGQSWKRKLQMGALFSLSIVMIGVTATRMPAVISQQGRQQYRTVWASCEILASATVSNAVILGSFLRDKGTKRNKYRNQSYSESVDRPSTRRPTITAIGSDVSDEDLFRSVGCRIPPHLQDHSVASPRPAPAALPASSSHQLSGHESGLTPLDTKKQNRPSDEQPVLHRGVLPSPAPSTAQSVSFFDIGSLIDVEASGSRNRTLWIDTESPVPDTHDFARPASSSHERSRPGSAAFLRDVGGMFSEVRPSQFSRRDGRESRNGREEHMGTRRQQKAPVGVLGPTLERQQTQISLQDAGGLLTPPLEHDTTGDGTVAHATPAISSRSGLAVPKLEKHQEDIELEDIGGLLNDTGRRSDDAAASLQKKLAEDRVTPEPSAPRRSERNFDDIVLNDPGGLMDKEG